MRGSFWLIVIFCTASQAEPQHFIQQFCLECHTGNKPKGGLTFSDLKADYAKESDVWLRIVERVRAKEMPPAKYAQPTESERTNFLHHVEKELQQLGAAPKAIHPNSIPHDALFDLQPIPPLDAPPRIWRLSPQLYDGLTAEFRKGPGSALSAPFATDPKQTFKDRADTLPVDEPTLHLLMRNAQAMVERQTRYTLDNGKIKGTGFSIKEFIALFDPQLNPLPHRVMDAAIQKQFQLILRRPAATEELERFRVFMQQNIASAGKEVGIRTTLAAVLLLPEAIYRYELTLGPPEDNGRRMLAAHELAYAIAAALTDRPPDRLLLEAVQKGKLSSAKDVEREVRRLLADTKTTRPRILRFFREFFGYDKAVEVFKDNKEYNEHDARALVADTDLLILDILQEDKQVFRQMLTTNRTYINYEPKYDKRTGELVSAKPRGNRKIYWTFGLNEWPTKQPIELPKEQRAGVLTQPSWLVAYSANTENHPIQRGKWIRERLLAGTIPDIPITVDAKLPEDITKTLRQRMDVTRDTYCWNCHQRMNPLGLPFEQYDHFGRYRQKELTKVVDTTGLIETILDEQLNGSVDNPIDLIHRLAASRKVQQVFIRHVFRHWLGRDETLGDARSLRQMDEAYTKSNGSMNELLVQLLTSEAFLYRVLPKD